jgi:hypothetical protein
VAADCVGLLSGCALMASAHSERTARIPRNGAI